MMLIEYVKNKSDGTVIGMELRGNGSPCVLVHGTTSDKSRWHDFIERHKSVYSFIAYDRRGRGDSNDNSEYSLEKEYEDLEAILDFIGKPAFVLGHSSGAIIALEACSRVPDKVSKLILYEPPIPTGTPLFDAKLLDQLQALIEIGEHENALELFYSDVVKMPSNDLHQLKNSQLWAARIKQAHTIPREMIASDLYRLDSDKIRVLDVPTLLLKGGDSPEIFTKPIDILGGILPKNNVTTMNGEQHIAMVTNPNLFGQKVLEFFNN